MHVCVWGGGQDREYYAAVLCHAANLRSCAVRDVQCLWQVPSFALLDSFKASRTSRTSRASRTCAWHSSMFMQCGLAFTGGKAASWPQRGKPLHSSSACVHAHACIRRLTQTALCPARAQTHAQALTSVFEDMLDTLCSGRAMRSKL